MLSRLFSGRRAWTPPPPELPEKNLDPRSMADTQKVDQKLVFKTDYRFRLVTSILQWEHSAILSTFINLPFVIKIFVLSFLLKTGFTVSCI